MAQNRHADAVAACLLLGDERTWLGRGPRRAIVGGALLTLLVALIVGRLWFHHHDVATLSMIGLTAGWGNYGYMGLPLLLTAYGPDGKDRPIWSRMTLRRH